MSQPLSQINFETAGKGLEPGASSLEGTLHAAAREVAQFHTALQEARSERNSAETEKLRLADRLQSLMDALPAAVLVLDGRGMVQECNPAAETLLQIPLTGRLWRELIEELFLPQSPSEEALALRNGRLVTLSTRPLGSEPGQVLMLQDVTDNFQLRSRLEHFRRLADMGRMAASLAHQIRTPLSSAILYLSQLRSPRLDADKRERFTSRALASLQGLEKLIGDMLLFANGGQGQQEFIRPRQLLAELVNEMTAKCRDSECELVMEPGEGLPAVRVNRVLLKSALSNLVMNAMEAGASRVKLALRQRGEQVVLIVRDNGPGIDAAAQQRIFEPFYSSRSDGTGLGLAVVRAVAQSMGGEVSLHSWPGEGAEFSIALPAARSGIASKSEQR